MTATGTLYGVGVGPGDPELMTLKAVRVLAACPVVAYFAKRGRNGNARTTAHGHFGPGAEEMRFEYPYTLEIPVDDPRYAAAMEDFYDEAANRITRKLEAGTNVAVLCEGDALLYGSYMYLHDRLAGRFASEVVAGVPAMSGCWARAGLPITRRDDVLVVLPATLDEDDLTRRADTSDAIVFMKVGRNLSRVRRVLDRVGRLDDAVVVERGTTEGERIARLADWGGEAPPYFSVVLVPGRRQGTA